MVSGCLLVVQFADAYLLITQESEFSYQESRPTKFYLHNPVISYSLKTLAWQIWLLIYTM